MGFTRVSSDTRRLHRRFGFREVGVFHEYAIKNGQYLSSLWLEKLFTEPHYNGYPAVLVRLPLIDPVELEELIVDAWRCQAPRALVEAWERGEA